MGEHNCVPEKAVSYCCCFLLWKRLHVQTITLIVGYRRLFAYLSAGEPRFVWFCTVLQQPYTGSYSHLASCRYLSFIRATNLSVQQGPMAQGQKLNMSVPCWKSWDDETIHCVVHLVLTPHLRCLRCMQLPIFVIKNVGKTQRFDWIPYQSCAW